MLAKTPVRNTILTVVTKEISAIKAVEISEATAIGVTLKDPVDPMGMK